MTLFIPFSCQDKQETSPKIDAQENTSEFFVNEDMAKIVAENFMRKTKPSLKSAKNYKLKKIKDEMGEELIYVINFDEGGFVLLPADNRINPVLAFSESNYFETENVEQLNGVGLWVSDTKDGIKKIKKSKELQSEEMKELWEKHLASFNLKDEEDPPDDPCEESHVTVGPIMGTTWRQGYGYNAECPTEAEVEDVCEPCDCYFFGDFRNGRALAGCTAIAMGQVMNYHEHPNNYSWNLMPTDTIGNSSAAELVFDIAEAVNTSYECDGSFAIDIFSTIVSVFENDFSYSSSVTLSGYSYNDFLDIRSEINADRPVVFIGTSIPGDHAWVCEGYQTSIYCINGLGYEYNYLYMNWGVRASAGHIDGFFYYNNFDGFTSNLKIVKGIKP